MFHTNLRFLSYKFTRN